MSFFEQLKTETEAARQELFSASIISRTLQGMVTIQNYIAFLTEAYHHVKHTVPLLMAAGARLPEEKEWLRNVIAKYIEEELGHQEWILNDIAACGVDKQQVRFSQPKQATELMVAYAYDMINRVNPLGLFGMVHVLEGTSITTAGSAADAIQQALGLPDKAFSYLHSHSVLDQQHVKFFEDVMNKINAQDEQRLIIHSTEMFYKLYGDIFRSLTDMDKE